MDKCFVYCSFVSISRQKSGIILAATRAMPSWKACQMEGASWSGTTEENIEKCVSTIGVEEPP